MEAKQTLKGIKFSYTAIEQQEGEQAKVKRFIASSKVPDLDPFLMLDQFNVTLPGGFPDHPHRGFELVTYLQSGTFCHEDILGHQGILGPGDVQWVTAGKGIVHSEMPLSFTEPAIGFQLWINLDKHNKYIEPRYQEIKSDEIPVYKTENMKAKVIAGEVLGVKGPIEVIVPTYYIDFELAMGAVYEHSIPKDWNSIIVVYEGEVQIQDNLTLKQSDCAIFEISNEQSETIKIKSLSDSAKFLLLAGQTINQPIVKRGPFVLSSQEEVDQTFYDYNNSQNGFEGAKEWQSENKNLIYFFY